MIIWMHLDFILATNTFSLKPAQTEGQAGKEGGVGMRQSFGEITITETNKDTKHSLLWKGQWLDN